jgi:hypothetical protein
MQVATIDRMLPVRSPPSSSHVKSQLRLPRTRRPQLTLASVVGGLDVSIIEEEEQSLPLPVDVAQSLSERRLGRCDRGLAVHPSAKLIEDRGRVSLSTQAALFGVVAGPRRFALDAKQLGDDAHALERDAVAAACGLDETASRVSPASRVRDGAGLARSFAPSRAGTLARKTSR